MNWYRVSPLSFVALAVLFYGIIGFFENGTNNFSVFLELFLPVFVVMILLDVGMQYILRSTRRTLLISQVILILAAITSLFYFFTL
ncbi:MAG: hypothetical protein ACHQD9_05350 [Chitinophagales bacterium]